MSGLVPETGFAQGASGPANVYDPALGATGSFLAGGASASAVSGGGTSGTTFPVTPSDGSLFTYIADATNGVRWMFIYNAGSASALKWEFAGGSPLFAEVVTAETTASGAYAALATAGPAIVLPFVADWWVMHGCEASNATQSANSMSYDIGGTGAVDGDRAVVGIPAAGFASTARGRAKPGLTAVTLTSKYKTSGGTVTFSNRWMAVWPVRK